MGVGTEFAVDAAIVAGSAVTKVVGLAEYVGTGVGFTPGVLGSIHPATRSDANVHVRSRSDTKHVR